MRAGQCSRVPKLKKKNTSIEIPGPVLMSYHPKLCKDVFCVIQLYVHVHALFINRPCDFTAR